MECRLCGGTFFVLLSNARKKLPSKKDLQKEKSSLTEADLLRALAKIIWPDFDSRYTPSEQALKDATRDFKQCNNWGGSVFQFDEASTRKTFDHRIRSEYIKALEEMYSLVDHYIDYDSSSRKDEYLVKAIVEVMELDKQIPDDEPFFVLEDGSTLTKAEIITESEVTLQPFLLGIWHYVITKVNDNKVGSSTYEEWCPVTSNRKRPYMAAIGENSSRNIKINYIGADFFDVFSKPEIASEKNGDNKSDPDERPESQTETVSIDEEESSSDYKKPTINNSFMFNFVQNGVNNTQIAHVENYYKDAKEE